MDSSYTSPTTKPIYKGTQIVWYLLGLAEALLAFRFALKLFGANPGAGFVEFIYSITQPLVAPFLGVFGPVKTPALTLELGVVLAMLVYWFLAWAIIKLFFISKTVSTPEAAQKLNEEETK